MPPAAALPVHTVARGIWPQARIAYIDSDPLVAARLRALAAADPGIAAVEEDLSRPADVLRDDGLDRVLDLATPVCVLLGAMLHYWPPDEAQAIVAGYASMLAPGSWIVASVTHVADPDLQEKVGWPSAPFAFSAAEDGAQSFPDLMMKAVRVAAGQPRHRGAEAVGVADRRDTRRGRLPPDRCRGKPVTAAR